MGLSTFKFVQWAPKTHLLRQSAFWTFKVVQGISRSMILVAYQLKARVRLSISRSLWLWSYLAPFLRYGDVSLKIAYFCYSSLIRRFCFLRFLWNFALKLTVRKLESSGYPQWRPHGRSWSRFGMIPASDRQPVGRSVRQNPSPSPFVWKAGMANIMANTALCIAMLTRCK